MALLIVVGLIVLLLLSWTTARLVNGQRYKIRSKSGIQRTGYIPLGGIEQYVQIRGQDRSNPIVIVLHGGPGNQMAYYSYAWQRDLEKGYTIVHWDQRGCGNTYYRNQGAPKPTLELLLSDLDELVDHVCAEYGKKKVIIMGHSWGTFLGKVYVGRHSEKVSAYVGVGQFNQVWKSEQHAVEEAVRLAGAAGKPQDAKRMEEQFQLVRSSQEMNMGEFMKLRQLTGKYLPTGENTPLSASLLSPYITFHDFKWFLYLVAQFERFVEIQGQLYAILFSKDELSAYDFMEYKVPVIVMAGDCDWITPFRMARDYFDHISAPQKEFILLEGAGHIPFRPGRFTKELSRALDSIQGIQ